VVKSSGILALMKQ